MNPDPHDPDFIEPASREADEVADEQLLHAMLTSRHEDETERQARMDRLHEAMGDTVPAATRPGPVLRPSWSVLSSAAAMILAVLGVFFVISRGESAQALVMSSIEASRDAGNRRYRVEMGVPELSPHPFMTGVLDIQDSEHVLMQARAHGHRIVVGLGDDGAFILHPDASLERLADGSGWPRWIDFDQSSFLIESIDQVLYRLHHEADLQRVVAEPLPEHDGPALHRVTATTYRDGSDLPGRVELWIDPETRQVVRLEYHWSLTVASHEQVRHRIRWPQAVHMPEEHSDEVQSVPPHRMVFELEGHPGFEPGWFAAERHQN